MTKFKVGDRVKVLVKTVSFSPGSIGVVKGFRKAEYPIRVVSERDEETLWFKDYELELLTPTTGMSLEDALTVDILDTLIDGIDTLEELDTSIENTVAEFVEERTTGHAEDIFDVWLACGEPEPENSGGSIAERMQRGVWEYIDAELKHDCAAQALLRFYLAKMDAGYITVDEYDRVLDVHREMGYRDGFQAYLDGRKDAPAPVRPVEIPEIGKWIEATTKDGKTYTFEVTRNDTTPYSTHLAKLAPNSSLMYYIDAKEGRDDYPDREVVSWKYVEAPVKPVEIDGYWIIRSKTVEGTVRAYRTEKDAQADGRSVSQAFTVDEAYKKISEHTRGPNRRYIPALLAIIKYIEQEEA